MGEMQRALLSLKKPHLNEKLPEKKMGGKVFRKKYHVGSCHSCTPAVPL